MATREGYQVLLSIQYERTSTLNRAPSSHKHKSAAKSIKGKQNKKDSKIAPRLGGTIVTYKINNYRPIMKYVAQALCIFSQCSILAYVKYH